MSGHARPWNRENSMEEKKEMNDQSKCKYEYLPAYKAGF
jgi:hypothetical protein